MKANIYFLIFS